MHCPTQQQARERLALQSAHKAVERAIESNDEVHLADNLTRHLSGVVSEFPLVSDYERFHELLGSNLFEFEDEDQDRFEHAFFTLLRSYLENQGFEIEHNEDVDMWFWRYPPQINAV